MNAVSLARVPRALVALALTALSAVAQAASINQFEYDALVTESQAKGAVRVMVQLATIPLSQMGGQTQALKASMNSRANAVLQELGTSAWKAGYWNNGIGQMGVYVNADGLRLLRSSSKAEFFGGDPTHRSRGTVHDPDGRIAAIEAAVEQRGSASVQVALNVANISMSFPRGGGVQHQRSNALSSEIASAVPAFLARLNAAAPSQTRRVSQPDPTIPSLTIDVGPKELAHLRESSDVRSLALVGWSDPRAFRMDDDVLAEAERGGVAEVIVELRMPHPAGMGAMPQRAWQTQSASMAQAAKEIVSALPSARNFQDLSAFGGLVVRLTASELKGLSASPDARLLSVRLNKPTAVTALIRSGPTMNMPATWAAGYRGAGQNIVVMDTGIRKSHALLQLNGATKVFNEICFGTNVTVGGVNWQSLCPAQNATGDSPLAYAGSGQPPASCSECTEHGTHVAGIAAGKDSPLMPALVTGKRLQGVAPDARLISAMIFSKAPLTGGLNVFDADLNGALQALFTNAGGDPFVVNLSIGTSSVYQGNCDSRNSTMANLVYQLKFQWRIPVVIAAGNSSARPGLSSPACISHTIKAAGTYNDGDGSNGLSAGNTLAPRSNIAADNLVGAIFLAPGWYVASSTGTSDTSTVEMGGTSMAAPHVSGFYSVLKAAAPGITVDDATAWIYGTGSVSAPQIWNGQTYQFRRIRSPV